MGEPANRFGHGDERAKYNQCFSHGLPRASLDEICPNERIEASRFPSTAARCDRPVPGRAEAGAYVGRSP